MHCVCIYKVTQSLMLLSWVSFTQNSRQWQYMTRFGTHYQCLLQVFKVDSSHMSVWSEVKSFEFDHVHLRSTWLQVWSHFLTAATALTTATLCWPEPQRLSRWRTSCNVSSTLLLVFPQKFDRGLLVVRHSELYWLDVPERISYKLGVMTYGYYGM